MGADSLSRSEIKEETDDSSDSDYDVKVKEEPEWNETETIVKQEIDLSIVKHECIVAKKEVSHEDYGKVRILKRNRDSSERRECDSSRVRTTSSSGSSTDSR